MKTRAKIIIHGAVQGVGFRPFVYKLANELKVNGSILNSSSGVFIDAESDSDLSVFIDRIKNDKPPRSFIQSFEVSYLDVKGYSKFEILKSHNDGKKTALILPDIAICDDCLIDIFDIKNRRYLYPFTNCTNCGPRFTIIESLPYDRANTSMKYFQMCEKCLKEYENPGDRRFHAQPNACPDCGPQLELWDKKGNVIAGNQEALVETAKSIREGRIAAVKGLGGFQLIADARNYNAIETLRVRKHREEKPFALMYPGMSATEKDCYISEAEKRVLDSVEKPIVLLRKKENTGIAENAAPDNPYLGVMLPYTPLHHILMRELNFPVVATSGNLSEEPICIDETEALKKLANIADIFLVHNRPILRHADDSIVRIIDQKEMVMRRARGYAPLPIKLSKCSGNKLAVGGHLKNTIAVNADDNVFISQHIGDLETAEAYNAFEKVINDFENIYELKKEKIISDLHPDYISTVYAKKRSSPVQVQHHYAHVMSCIAENEITEPVLGISWDGTGYGTDGTIWGSEFLITNGNGTHSEFYDTKGFRRFAHLRTFRLPGGVKAIKETWRIAAGLCYELNGDNLFKNSDLYCFKDRKEIEIIKNMLQKNINSPLTSSMGRLFDGIASLCGVTQRSSYEGQAAMKLEFLTFGFDNDECYEYKLCEQNNETRYVIDWQKMIEGVLSDSKDDIDKKIISVKFHNTLINIINEIALLAGIRKVVLTGGCFQNKYLLEGAIKKLKRSGFETYRHQRVPSNDGGISLGQIAAANKEL